MKWLILTEKFDKNKRFEHHRGNGFTPIDTKGKMRLKDSVDLIDKAFIIYLDNNSLKAELHRDFHTWIRYPLDKKFNDKRQIAYEIFSGGWLQFYDEVLSSEGAERRLYLEWSDDYVEIFISNPPEGKGYKQSVLDFISKGFKKVDYNIEYSKKYGIPLPADSDVDPPPPPYPPPPPDA